MRLHRLISLLAFASPFTVPPHLKAAEPAKPFEGQTLRVLSYYDTNSQAISSRLSQFEEMTGASVNFRMIYGDEIYGPLSQDTALPHGYDAVTIDQPFIARLSSQLLPFDQWPIANKEAAFDLPDFIPQALRDTEYQGVSYGIPINANVYVYTYRMDLFSNSVERNDFRALYGYELRPARNAQEFLDIARFFNRPPHLYGFAPSTEYSEGTTVEAIWLFNMFDINLLDFDDYQALRVDQVESAFKYYLELIKLSPPKSGDWHNRDKVNYYSRGRIAQMMSWPSFMDKFESPVFSLVAGRNRYTASPRGIQGTRSAISGTWSLGICKDSENVALAAAFAEWWTSEKLAKIFVRKGMNPGKVSLLRNEALLYEKPWLNGIIQSFDESVSRPKAINYEHFSQIISDHFTAVIHEDLTPREAAKALKKALLSLELK